MISKTDAFVASEINLNQPYIEKEVNTSQQYQPDNSQKTSVPTINLSQSVLICPNCGSALEGRKCKLFCPLPGCGYLVTCSAW